MPARVFRIMSQDETQVMIESIWEEKIKWVSKVTPIKYAESSSHFQYLIWQGLQYFILC